MSDTETVQHTCTECGQDKPKSEFSARQWKMKGRCKDCTSARDSGSFTAQAEESTKDSPDATAAANTTETAVSTDEAPAHDTPPADGTNDEQVTGSLIDFGDVAVSSTPSDAKDESVSTTIDLLGDVFGGAEQTAAEDAADDETAKLKADEERKTAEEAERKAKEAEEEQQRRDEAEAEAEAARQREVAEKAKDEEEKAKKAAEEEAERERKAKEEEEEEERKAAEAEAARKKEEEDERKAKEAAEAEAEAKKAAEKEAERQRKAKEEEERKAAEEEAARKRKEEEERKAVEEEAARKRKEEEERKAKEEAEAAKKAAEQEEAERQRKAKEAEEERKATEAEVARKQKEEEERKAAEEEAERKRKAKEEEERKAAEAELARKQKEEEERKAREEAEANEKKAAEEKAKQEEEAKAKREEEERKAKADAEAEEAAKAEAAKKKAEKKAAKERKAREQAEMEAIILEKKAKLMAKEERAADIEDKPDEPEIDPALLVEGERSPVHLLLAAAEGNVSKLTRLLETLEVEVDTVIGDVEAVGGSEDAEDASLSDDANAMDGVGKRGVRLPAPLMRGDEHSTALHIACRHQRAECVRYLLDRGASVYTLGRKQRHALLSVRWEVRTTEYLRLRRRRLNNALSPDDVRSLASASNLDEGGRGSSATATATSTAASQADTGEVQVQDEQQLAQKRAEALAQAAEEEAMLYDDDGDDEVQLGAEEREGAVLVCVSRLLSIAQMLLFEVDRDARDEAAKKVGDIEKNAKAFKRHVDAFVRDYVCRRDERVDAAIVHASACGNWEAVQMLCDSGALPSIDRQSATRAALDLVYSVSTQGGARRGDVPPVRFDAIASTVAFLVTKAKGDVNASDRAQARDESAAAPTLLHMAADARDEPLGKLLCRTLLKHGARTEVFDGDKRTPLYWAARRAHAGTCRVLVKEGRAKVNAPTGADKMTALMRAAQSSRDDPGPVRALLLLGARADARDVYGETALHKAATRDNYNVLGALLGSSQVAGTVLVRMLNRFAQTPLHLAAQYARARSVQMLLNATACAALNVAQLPSELTEREAMLVDAYVQRSLSGRCGLGPDVAEQGMTPLMLLCSLRLGDSPTDATEDEMATVARLLCDSGASLRQRGQRQQKTPLMMAVHRYARPAPVLVWALCELSGVARIDINERVGGTGDNADATALTYACDATCASMAIVRLLLDRGADPNAWADRMWSPLHFAAMSQHQDLIALLLLYGARTHNKVRIVDAHGNESEENDDGIDLIGVPPPPGEEDPLQIVKEMLKQGAANAAGLNLILDALLDRIDAVAEADDADNSYDDDDDEELVEASGDDSGDEEKIASARAAPKSSEKKKRTTKAARTAADIADEYAPPKPAVNWSKEPSEAAPLVQKYCVERRVVHPNARCFTFDGEPTLLHLAVLARDIESVRLLLGAGADPMLVDLHGDAPADLADNEDIELLLEGAEHYRLCQWITVCPWTNWIDGLDRLFMWKARYEPPGPNDWHRDRTREAWLLDCARGVPAFTPPPLRTAVPARVRAAARCLRTARAMLLGDDGGAKGQNGQATFFSRLPPRALHLLSDRLFTCHNLPLTSEEAISVVRHAAHRGNLVDDTFSELDLCALAFGEESWELWWLHHDDLDAERDLFAGEQYAREVPGASGARPPKQIASVGAAKRVNETGDGAKKKEGDCVIQ